MKLIKSFLFILVLTLSFQHVAKAQPDDEYNDLLFLLVDAKYDKLLYKSMGYIEDEDTRKDPLPYLYTSMCYFEMSKLEEYDEEFPRAFKDAVKYCVKYRKKDASGFYVEENAEYIDDLKLQTFEIADNYSQIGKASKAKSFYKDLVGIDPNDWGAWLLKGVSESELNMTADAKISLETGVKGIESVESIDSYLRGQRTLFKMGIISYGEYLKESGKLSEAKEIMGIGNKFLKDDNEFKIAYDAIMRG